MHGSILVSIIMPAYNAEAFLAQSIESVIAQTYTDWELIIIDDGSTDSTKDIVLSFQKKDSRLQYIYQPNGKQGKARNKGLAKASGDYIAFLDADDCWIPCKLMTQIELISATSGDLVFSDIIIIDEKNQVLHETNRVMEKQYSDRQGVILFLQSNRIPLLTVLAKKSAILSAQGFDESAEIQYGEDYFLWLRMLINGSVFESSAEKLAFYRRHNKQSIVNVSDKYMQMITRLTDLWVPGNLKNHKSEAINTWIRRYLSATKSVEKKELKKISAFLPSAVSKKMATFISTITPSSIQRKIIYMLTFLF